MCYDPALYYQSPSHGHTLAFFKGEKVRVRGTALYIRVH